VISGERRRETGLLAERKAIRRDGVGMEETGRGRELGGVGGGGRTGRSLSEFVFPLDIVVERRSGGSCSGMHRQGAASTDRLESGRVDGNVARLPCPRLSRVRSLMAGRTAMNVASDKFCIALDGDGRCEVLQRMV
jgi:hypothetical protein